MKLKYVLPIHNEAKLLETKVAKLLDKLDLFPGSAIALSENGSSDESFKICEQLILANKNRPTKIYATTSLDAGIGVGYFFGIKILLKSISEELSNCWFFLSAADLPFDFSDLDSFLSEINSGNKAKFYIGSKSHHKSKIDVSFKRMMGSRLYNLIRTLILNMKTGDPHGVLIVRGDIVAQLADHIKARDFFFPTEFVYMAEKNGIIPFEIPIIYPGIERPSNVSLLKDGFNITKEMIKLRRSIR